MYHGDTTSVPVKQSFCFIATPVRSGGAEIAVHKCIDTFAVVVSCRRTAGRHFLRTRRAPDMPAPKHLCSGVIRVGLVINRNNRVARSLCTRDIKHHISPACSIGIESHLGNQSVYILPKQFGGLRSNNRAGRCAHQISVRVIWQH